MIKINKLVLKFDTSMRVDKSLITNIFQYSQAKLVVLLTSITSDLGFSWVTPGGYQFEERSLAYDPDENITGYYAYSATIYPGFTIGFPQNVDTSFCIVSVRKGTTRSPLIRVPVDRTIEPTLTILPESNYTELASRVLDLETFESFVDDGTYAFSKVKMSVDTPAATLEIGETRWNNTDKCLETRVNDEVILQHGQEQWFYAEAGENIGDGKAVYVFSGHGSSPIPIVKLADKTGNGNSIVAGISTQPLTTGQKGFFVTRGRVNNLYTPLAVGTPLYLGTNGDYTTSVPDAPDRKVFIGWVVKSHGTKGSILVALNVFPKINELSDVAFEHSNGRILYSDGAKFISFNLDSALAQKPNLTGGNSFTGNQSVNGTISAYGISASNASLYNINMNNNVVKNVGEGISDSDCANIGNVQSAIANHDTSPTAHANLFAGILTTENVYTKSETYNKTEVNNLVSDISIPVISTNIETDALSDTKASSPKSVKTYVDGKLSSTYRPAGSLTAAEIVSALLIEANLGKVYNINQSFTTTSDFVEGTGINHPAGTNIVIVEIAGPAYKFDVLSGFVDLSGYALTGDIPTDISDLTDNSSLLGDANVLEGVIVDTTELTITNKKVTIPAANTTNQDGLITWENNAKLAGIETGAQVNDLESVKVGGSTLAITGKAVDIVSVPVTTTTPVANWTGAGYKIAILSSDPATKYTGWIYIITG